MSLGRRCRFNDDIYQLECVKGRDVVQLEDLIEFVLTHTDEIKIAITDQRIDAQKGSTGGGTGHSKISDPTALRAIKNITESPVVYVQHGPIIAGKMDAVKIKRPERWLKVEKQTREYYLGNERMSDFYKLRYIKQLERRQVWERLCIKKGLYYAMASDVTRFAMMCAVASGLIGPYSKFHTKV